MPADGQYPPVLFPLERRDRSCPRNCRREALLQSATGRSLGRREQAKIRQPGDLPFHRS